MAAGEKTTGRDRLSEQEGQVLALVVEGKTNKEISASLNLIGKTVKNHRATIFKKLQVIRPARVAALLVKQHH